MFARAFGLAVVVACAGFAARAADVVVNIERVPSSKGQVHVDLCTQATFLTPNCPYDGSDSARKGRVIITVRNVPPGRYAVVAYHDENSNGELDLNLLGIPKEAFGFSNDPPMLFGPPLFKDSSFEVGDTDVEVKVRLKR